MVDAAPDNETNLIGQTNQTPIRNPWRTNRGKDKNHDIDKESIKVFYSNVDTLSNKMKILETAVEIHNPDIIVLAETKPKNTRYKLQTSEIQVDGYTLHENIEESGRGVCIYAKAKLNPSEIKVNTYGSEESVWVEIGGNNVVGCIYRSPNSSEENNCKINEMMRNLTALKHNLLVMGDFNYPEIIWTDPEAVHATERKADAFLQSTYDSYLIQHVQGPTRYRGNQTQNTLDLIFTSDEDAIQDLQYEAPLGNSDHCTLIFNYNAGKQKTVPEKVIKNYTKADYDAMRREMGTINWEQELEHKDVEEAWKFFKDKLNECCTEHVPTIKVGKHRPLWMDKNAITKVRKKYAAWKRYLETKDGKDYLKFARARNQSRWATRKAQRNFEAKLAKDVKRNPKPFWKYVHSKTKSKSRIPDLKTRKNNGEGKTENDQEKAEVLSDYFKDVFINDDGVNMPQVDININHAKLDKIEITREAVLKKLKALNVNKTPGSDGIHPRVLKELQDEVQHPLTIIFQKSQKEKRIPKEWKDADVTPIHKKGSKQEPGNYRPVSLTAICCKLQESIVKDCIMEHLLKENDISDHQHGFLSGRSTKTQLIETLEDWTKILENEDNFDALYCDFRKAFDSVSHKRLLVKIRKYGIDGELAAWIEDFLTGRRQRVCVNGHFSSWENVTSGVPQGSILGPLLFILYINDLPDTVKCGIKLYADDTKIYQKVNNGEDAKEFQENIDELYKWSLEWQLLFHPDKCHVVHFGKSNIEQSYHMGDVQLDTTEEEKDLGVVTDNKLRFSKHCDKIVTSCNKILGIMRRNINHMDTTVFNYLYKGLVRPVIEYASTVYNPILMADIHKLESIQRRATKMVIGMYNLSYEERLRRLELPCLRFRRCRGDMIETYKYLHHKYSVTELIPRVTSTRTRGHSLKITQEKCKTRLRLNFFTQRIMSAWNNLNEETVSAQTVNSFKNKLDKEWDNLPGKYDYLDQWFG